MLALLDKADESGYLTMEDILEAYQPLDDSPDEAQKIVLYLRRKGVEIIEYDDDAEDLETETDNPVDESNYFANLEKVSASDTVEIYLKEMSRVPLLTVEEEISLAKRIEKGREAQAELIQLNGRKSAQRRKAIEEAVRDAYLAREHIIKANTRLVVSIAKKYNGRGVPSWI